MRYILLFLIVASFANSSLLDFKYIKDAKSAYLKGDYEKARELYSKIEKDEAKFNLGDSLYREGKYKEAIEVFNSISNKKLEAKKLHNIGNSYAKLGEIDKAIKAYEDALKIKFDEDTKYNLDLLKKKKEEQKKKQKQNQDQNKQQDKNKKDSKDNKNSQNKDKDKKDNQNQNKKNEDSNNTDSKNSKNDNNQTNRENKPKPTPTPDKNKEKGGDKKQEQDKNKEPKENNNTDVKGFATPPPISNMEERKWQRLLNKRGINSLMLEIDNKNKRRGENIDEINPW
jgi:Ca-activated chloride channel family protein